MTDEDIQASNAQNDRYLFDLEIADLARERYIKGKELLQRINALFLDELHRIKRQ